MEGKEAPKEYPKQEDFGYLKLPEFGDRIPPPETFKEKLWRKTKQNPFVPVGLGVTTFALTYGLWQLKTGDRVMSQKMMRLRVGAQSFTVVALLAGVFYNSYQIKQKRKMEAMASGK